MLVLGLEEQMAKNPAMTRSDSPSHSLRNRASKKYRRRVARKHHVIATVVRQPRKVPIRPYGIADVREFLRSCGEKGCDVREAKGRQGHRLEHKSERNRQTT